MNTSTTITSRTSKLKIVVGILLILLVTGAYFYIYRTGLLSIICDCSSINEFVRRLGIWGPFVIVGLMAGAIVMSPIPSAPIALAAGMAYGHLWGTLYIVIGAELGAIIAFTIGRLVGYEVLHRWFGGRLNMGLLGSQNSLMIIVFTGRLLPFISFDILSYAAGLTSLRFWRFAVATLAGIIPISFLLAHFGGELGSADMQRVTITVLLLGSITLLPIAVKWFLVRRKSREKAGFTEKKTGFRTPSSDG